MRSERVRCRPALEPLELRVVLSTTANTIHTASGVISRPGQVVPITSTVKPSYLAAGRSTVLGLTAQPQPGSRLLPRTLPVRLPGQPVTPFRHARNFVPGLSSEDLSFVQVRQAGPVTTGVTGRHGTTGGFDATTFLPGDLNGDGQVNLNDLRTFTPAFMTRAGDGFYNPSADANRNGFIGHGDARMILRNMTPLTPKIPLNIEFCLAPGDQVNGTKWHTSGGLTYKKTVTIIGRTTPGSIVFADSGLGDYSFNGAAIATDAQGFFEVKVTNAEGLNNYNFLAIDPYGQQKIRDFPIFWISYALNA